MTKLQRTVFMLIAYLDLHRKDDPLAAELYHLLADALDEEARRVVKESELH